MRTLTSLMALIVVGSMQAMADEPTVIAAPPAATAPPTAASTAADSEAAAAAQAQARIKRIRAQGYKPNGEQNGQPVYCRSETPIGSHLANRVCRTADQIDAAALAGQDAVRDAQQRANVGPQSH